MVDGLTAFVTGASRGIGREIAIELAQSGTNVSLVARSDGIYETAELIDAPNRTATVKTDVTSESSVRAALETTVEKFGAVDILVNNAGIAGPTKPVEEVELDEWSRTLDVNVTGMFLTVKHAVDHLRDSDQGSIVNISSISGKRPLLRRTPYTTSKMAVIGFSRTLAFELGPDDITVNAICPGATSGPRIRSVIEKQAEHLEVSYDEAKRRTFTSDAALGALVDPEDVAGMVRYLASERGRHITGQDINVDAGTAWY